MFVLYFTWSLLTSDFVQFSFIQCDAMRAAKEVEAEAEKKRYTKYDVSNQIPHNTKSKLK